MVASKGYLPEAERKHWTMTHGPMRRQVFDTVFGGVLPVFFFLLDPFLFKTFAFVTPGMHAEYRLVAYGIHASAALMLVLFLFLGRRSVPFAPVIAAVLVTGCISLAVVAIAAIPLAFERLWVNFGAFSSLTAILSCLLVMAAVIMLQNAGRCLSMARARLRMSLLDGAAYWLMIAACVVALLCVEDIRHIVNGLSSDDPETRISSVLKVQEGAYMMDSDVVLRQYIKSDDATEKLNLARSYRQLTGADVQAVAARQAHISEGSGE